MSLVSEMSQNSDPQHASEALREHVSQFIAGACQSKYNSLRSMCDKEPKLLNTLTDSFQKSILDVVHKKLNVARDLSDPDAHVPYQETLSAEIKQQIDSGELTLHGLCQHPEIGCKYTSKEVLDNNVVFRNLFVPAQAMRGYSMRHFHSIVHNCDSSAIRGDRANRVQFDTLWNATSPQLNAADPSRRFSLISSVLALRKSAMNKNTQNFGAFVHYEHEANCVCAEGTHLVRVHA